ncbi:MAG: hypothetical protein AB7K24_15705 [Gemmataceae bacterium]
MKPMQARSLIFRIDVLTFENHRRIHVHSLSSPATIEETEPELAEAIEDAIVTGLNNLPWSPQVQSNAWDRDLQGQE